MYYYHNEQNQIVVLIASPWIDRSLHWLNPLFHKCRHFFAQS